MLSVSRKLAPIPSFVRGYAGKYRRPRPGTSERPPLKHRDPLLSSPNATMTQLEDENLLFVHRPPPSIPSPVSTTAAPSSPLLQPRASSQNRAALPPLVRQAKPLELKEMSEEDVARMRELRLNEPEKYSANTLAKMFGCTRLFVSEKTRIRTSQRTMLLRKRDEEHDKHRNRWSDRHQLVKVVRTKRREMW